DARRPRRVAGHLPGLLLGHPTRRGQVGAEGYDDLDEGHAVSLGVVTHRADVAVGYVPDDPVDGSDAGHAEGDPLDGARRVADDDVVAHLVLVLGDDEQTGEKVLDEGL